MKKVKAHARRFWHVHLTILGLAFLLAFLAGAFAGPAALKTVFGQKLNAKGQQLYRVLDAKNVEQGQRAGSETPPPAVAARIAAAAARVPTLEPKTLATPEPVTFKAIVRNYSDRHGSHPILLVVHDAEMPNAPGVQDLRAIDAWFNNPSAQASSNYSTDSDGNTVLMVPTSAKAWTQAWFNSWAISDELLGYASQKTWPLAQLQATARLFAHDAIEYGIPVQHAIVNGCTIVRAGIIQHNDLGQCGGGHHDAGPNFPISRFIGMVALYKAAMLAPAPKTAPVPVVKPSSKPAPKPVARRCRVKDVQYALNTRAHVRPRLAVDGILGPHTRAALARAGGLSKIGLHCRLAG